MISFFPDLDAHATHAWHWLDQLPDGAMLLFSRYTQVGLLRLLTNAAVMREYTLTVREAWAMYDRWLNDPRVQFHSETHRIEAAFHQATEPFAGQRASKWIGDCYLLAFARESGATLVTSDRALLNLAQKQDYTAITPGSSRPPASLFSNRNLHPRVPTIRSRRLTFSENFYFGQFGTCRRIS